LKPFFPASKVVATLADLFVERLNRTTSLFTIDWHSIPVIRIVPIGIFISIGLVCISSFLFRHSRAICSSADDEKGRRRRLRWRVLDRFAAIITILAINLSNLQFSVQLIRRIAGTTNYGSVRPGTFAIEIEGIH
jgi:hypothetical protein